MKTDSIVINTLDTIGQQIKVDMDTINGQVYYLNRKLAGLDIQYKSLQQSLETLNSHNSWDIWVRGTTVVIALVSAVIAIILFYMNRNKDFKIKKAEIAGEIYGSIFEFKRRKILWLGNIMKYNAYVSALILAKDEAKSTSLGISFGIGVPNDPINKVDEYKADLDKTTKELLNKIGQYRFYVSKGEKAALKFHTNAIDSRVEQVREPMFINNESLEEIEATWWSNIYEAIEAEKTLLNKQLDAIEGIIDDYDKFIKETDLYAQ